MKTIDYLHKQYEEGKTPSDILKDIYHNIEEDNKKEDKINAFNHLTKNLAQEQAESGFDPNKPLSGVFVGVKDNIHIEGEPTTCSSKILSNYQAIYDACVVENLKKAGAILVGKCSMDEFAMGSTNETSYFGVVRNPHDRTRVPGGSSGGSCAAVAADFVSMSLGSDTGGSIRLPASYCSVVGLKPTYGAISRYGVMAMASILDQVGPVAHNVKDCIRLFNVLKSYDPRDPNSIDFPDVDLKAVESFSGKKKIAVIKEFSTDEVDGAVREQFEKTITSLKKEGHEVTEVSLKDAKYAIQAYLVISRVQSFSALSMIDGIRFGERHNAENLESLYMESRLDGFHPETTKRLLAGSYFLAYTDLYEKARKTQTLLFNQVEAIFQSYDLIISPTSPDIAPPLKSSNNEFSLEGYLSDMITSIANLTSIPALSVPMGKVDGVYPVGLQIMAPLKKEQDIFELAYQIEKMVSHDN